MVISPEGLEKRIEKAITTQFDSLARQIDKYLETARMGAGSNASYEFPVGKCSDNAAMKSEILQRTIKAYETVGWNVRYDANKDELTFKKKK